ncbi:MAG: UDP-N-acetylmuramoyl-tripeptide--D-alanyl-D-alanine ligase, partial [Alphaproteobacteria bacterium]
ILNRDIDSYPILRRAARAAGARILRFGAGGRPDFRLTEARLGEGGTVVSARIGGQRLIFKLGAPGRHLALNALAALAAASAAGADLARAAVALAGWHAPPGRGARLRIGLGAGEIDGHITLIDESYNANPASLGAALEVLAATRPQDDVGRVARGRRIAVLGDMLELGAEEEEAHRRLAEHPALRAVDRIHCAGPLMKALHAALPSCQRGEWFPASEALAARLPRLIDAGDVIMVKGSLGSRMGRVVDALRALGPVSPEPPEEG